jgi:acetyltransferase-like isoleucine patch superfamily enzyme
MGWIQSFLLDIRTQRKWYHKALYRTAHTLRGARLPLSRPVGAILFNGRNAALVAWRRIKQFFIYEPMLRYRCRKVGRGVYLEVNFPLILGYGSIDLGDRVRIGGNVNLMVSYKVHPNPTITVGDDVYLGYETLLSCAERIEIGNRVLVAERATIFDNNNHPLDPQARADNAPVEKEQIAPVKIEDEAWIGAGAIILKGVTVGRGAVVATGAVVTKDVPARTIVAGNPARVVKKIP